MNETLYFIFAIIPAIAWINYFYRTDKGEPESIKLLLIAFFMGALVVIPAAYIEIFVTKNLLPSLFFNGEPIPTTFFPYFILFSFIVVAIVEELFKYLSLRFSVYYSDGFNEYSDGIIYIVTVALGFAAFENFLYFLNFGPDIVVVRSIFTPLFHASASAIVGHYMIQMKYSKVYKRTVAFALMFSMIIHFLYNLLVYNFSSSGNYWYVIIASGLLLLSAKWMFDKFKEAEEIDEKCWDCINKD